MGSGGSHSLLPPGKLVAKALTKRLQRNREVVDGTYASTVTLRTPLQTTWVLYGQASRAISTG